MRTQEANARRTEGADYLTDYGKKWLARATEDKGAMIEAEGGLPFSLAHAASRLARHLPNKHLNHFVNPAHDKEWGSAFKLVCNTLDPIGRFDDSAFVVIEGDIGTGKTQMAVEYVRREVVARGRRAKLGFTTVDELISRLWDKDNPENIEVFTGVELLVIDEFTGRANRERPGVADTLFAIVNARYNSTGQRTIITTNNLSELVRDDDDAPESCKKMLDRLREAAVIVSLSGDSKRRE